VALFEEIPIYKRATWRRAQLQAGSAHFISKRGCF
jgi:hypothetical protein